jgi:hypothetical protein
MVCSQCIHSVAESLGLNPSWWRRRTACADEPLRTTECPWRSLRSRRSAGNSSWPRTSPTWPVTSAAGKRWPSFGQWSAWSRTRSSPPRRTCCSPGLGSFSPLMPTPCGCWPGWASPTRHAPTPPATDRLRLRPTGSCPPAVTAFERAYQLLRRHGQGTCRRSRPVLPGLSHQRRLPERRPPRRPVLNQRRDAPRCTASWSSTSSSTGAEIGPVE